MATPHVAAATRVEPWRRVTWQRPEWPWTLLAISAWVVLILDQIWPKTGTPIVRPLIDHQVETGRSMDSHIAGSHSQHHQGLSTAGLGWWMLMTVAMMVPATLPMLREISWRSIWTRRYQSAAIFLACYLSVWGSFGALALGIWSLAAPRLASASTVLTGAALLTAAAWALSDAKRRFLKRCHRYLPLASRGRAADRSCLQLGLYHACQCVGVCWPLMLAMVPSNSFVLMLGLAALLTWERLARIPRLRIGAMLLAVVGTIQVFGAA